MRPVTDEALTAATSRVAVDLAIGVGKLTAPPVVGLREVGRMFRVGWNTPYQWRARKQMPKADDTISGNPIWRITTIYKWAAETNRLIVWDPWGVVASDVDEEGPTEAEPADASRPIVPEFSSSPA